MTVFIVTVDVGNTGAWGENLRNSTSILGVFDSKDKATEYKENRILNREARMFDINLPKITEWIVNYRVEKQ